MKAKSGIYCGPKLANEIYNKLKTNNLACNLDTQLETIIEPDSKFYSCSLKTACKKTDILFECAVIDEIENLGDREKGSAWTQCLLGL